MIELFDAQRLLPRRDPSAWIALAALALGAGTLAIYAGQLQQQLRQEQVQKTELQGRLRLAQAKPGPSAALLADLQREVQLLEAELGAAQTGNADANRPALSPSAWLERLAAMGRSDVSLMHVDIDRQGQTQIEGLALNAEAVSAFVQEFSRQEQLAGLKPRAVELREDKAAAPYLRFQLRASAKPAAQGPQAAPSTTPSPAAATGVRS